MPHQRTLSLTEAEKTALEQVARSGVKAYQRERAAALLKIASGQSARSESPAVPSSAICWRATCLTVSAGCGKPDSRLGLAIGNTVSNK
jgi:hypothetical protein